MPAWPALPFSAGPCHIKSSSPILALKAPITWLHPTCASRSLPPPPNSPLSPARTAVPSSHLPHVMLRAGTNPLPTNTIQISSLSHSAYLSLYQAPSPFFALCHPTLRYIPQCQQGHKEPVWELSTSRLASGRHHIAVVGGCPF